MFKSNAALERVERLEAAFNQAQEAGDMAAQLQVGARAEACALQAPV